MSDVTTQARLADGIRAVMEDIVIAADGLTARVGDQEVSADYPREMTRVLAEAIYNVYHAGQPLSAVPSRLRDRRIEERLRAVTPQRTTSAQVRLVRLAEEDDRAKRVLVSYRGVRVWMPVDGVDLDGVGPGDVMTVPFPALRPAVSPGYFLVEGARGWTRVAQVMRLYFHLPAVDVADVAWGAVLEHLENVSAPYRAKILTVGEFYPRRDALVVYTEDTASDLAYDLAERLAALDVLADATSPFARRIGPGAALAMEPRDQASAYSGLSFGQHRATLLATALLAAREDPDDREKEVFETFAQHGVDPTAPALNLSI